jgi:integrase
LRDWLSYGDSQRFHTFPKAAKLPSIRLRDLTHGAATLAVAGSVNLVLIRRRLGHSDIATTIDLYARHELVDTERAAANTVAGLIDGQPRLQSVARTGWSRTQR